MRTYSFGFRITTWAMITLFAWSYGPLFQMPTALAAERKTAAKEQASRPVNREQRPEEKFEGVLTGLREEVNKAGEKNAKGEDDSAEMNAIRAKKTELDGLAEEIRAELASTEKTLKDKGLPQEIINRHYRFSRNFEDNLQTLKANLADAEAAKTSADRKAKIEKVRLHLEKTKAPSRHQRLDPTKPLPFSARKAKAPREPRLKKEQFEKDFPPQKHKGMKTAFLPQSAQSSPRTTERAGLHNSAITGKPIVLAFNGPASDMPLPLSEELRTQNSELKTLLPETAFSTSSPIILAQATTDLPTPDDLAENGIEIQFTDAIRAKAQELGGNPVRIYEWTRSNIEYAPTYGSIQGADMCLQSRICNDTDTASLLIALLRVSGIYSHYVYSTVEIPIEKAMNLVGGVTNPNMVATIFATNGVPVRNVISGGTIKAVQIERVTVSAFIDYIPSRGAVHRQGDTWIPLDPSFKQYDIKLGMDLYTAMGISGEQYLLSYITDTSSLSIPAELQASFPAYTISPYQYYSKRLFNYLDANFPDATYQDIFGSDTIEASKTIIKKEYPYFMGTLPYIVVAQGAEYSTIPDSLRHKVNFVIQETGLDGGLSYTTGLPETAGKRITLSYVTATAADESVVAQYGTLLNVPPYLLTVKPVLKIAGITVATGSPIGLGQEQTFNMTFNIPNIGTELVSNTVTAGDYSAIAVLSQKVPVNVAGDKMETLINNIGSTDLDDLLGQMLYNVGISYFHHLNFEGELYAKNFQMIMVKGLSEAMITSHAITAALFGVPYDISEGGIGIDVDKNEYMTFSFDGSQNRARDFMVVSGLGSSAWEDRVLQAFYDVPSVSAARLLRFAKQQGVAIYTIDGSNIDSMLLQLQISPAVTDDIRNAVNAGKKIIISKTGVQYEGMNAIGYIVFDPATGAAAYMISGGAAGGMGTRKPATSVRNVSQYFWGDGSALQTIWDRAMIVMLAFAQLDTPYFSTGADPDTGFDCSGLVYYLYKTVYGKYAFPYKCGIASCGMPGSISGCANCQHEYLISKKWTHPYDEKLDGDILWSDNYGHTGVYYGIPITGTFSAMDSVIHATSSHLGPGGRIYIHKVVITSTNNDQFTGGSHGGIMPDIGRPVPYVIDVSVGM